MVWGPEDSAALREISKNVRELVAEMRRQNSVKPAPRKLRAPDAIGPTVCPRCGKESPTWLPTRDRHVVACGACDYVHVQAVV